MVKGVSATQRTQLKAISAGGAETPLRIFARLCEEAGDDAAKAALIPPIQSVKNQRKKEVQSACAGDAQVSQSVLQWKRFVRDIAYDRKEWETASPFRLFSVTIELAEAPPICLLVCRAFPGSMTPQRT